MQKDQIAKSPLARRGRFQNGSYYLSEPITCAVNIINKFENFKPFGNSQGREENIIQISSLPVVPKALYELFPSRLSDLALPASGVVGYTTAVKDGKYTTSIGVLKTMQDIVKLCCIWSGSGWKDYGISFWIECGDEVINRNRPSPNHNQKISNRTNTPIKSGLNGKDTLEYLVKPDSSEQRRLPLVVSSCPTDEAAIDVGARVEVPTSYLRKPVVLFIDRPPGNRSLPTRLRVSLGFSTRSPLTKVTHTSLAYTIARNIETGENMNYPLSLLLNTSSRPASLCSLSRNAGLKPTVRLSQASNEQDIANEPGHTIAQALEEPKNVPVQPRNRGVSGHISLQRSQNAPSARAPSPPNRPSQKPLENNSSRGDLSLSGPSPWAEINVEQLGLKHPVDNAISDERRSRRASDDMQKQVYHQIEREPIQLDHHTQQYTSNARSDKMAHVSPSSRPIRSNPASAMAKRCIFSSKLHPELSCMPIFDLSPSNKKILLPLRGSDKAKTDRIESSHREEISIESLRESEEIRGKRKRLENDVRGNRSGDEPSLVPPLEKKLKDQDILDDLVTKMLSSCEEIARGAKETLKRAPPRITTSSNPTVHSKNELTSYTPSPKVFQSSNDHTGGQSGLLGSDTSPAAPHFATSDLSALRQRLLRSRMSLRVESSQYGDDFSPLPNEAISNDRHDEDTNSGPVISQPRPNRPEPRLSDIEKNGINEQQFLRNAPGVNRALSVSPAVDEQAIEPFLPRGRSEIKDNKASQRTPSTFGANPDETRRSVDSSTAPTLERRYSIGTRRPSLVDLDRDRVYSNGHGSSQDDSARKEAKNREAHSFSKPDSNVNAQREGLHDRPRKSVESLDVRVSRPSQQSSAPKQAASATDRRVAGNSLAHRFSDTSRDRTVQARSSGSFNSSDPSLRSRSSNRSVSLTGHRSDSASPEAVFERSTNVKRMDGVFQRPERAQNTDSALRSRLGANRPTNHGLSSSSSDTPESKAGNKGGFSPFNERRTLRARLSGSLAGSRENRDNVNERETPEKHSLPRRTASLQDLRSRKTEISPYGRDQDSRSQGFSNSSQSPFSLRSRLSDRRRSPPPMRPSLESRFG